MQELLKNLEILTQMMREYAERNNEFVKVEIFTDGCGGLLTWDSEEIFEFTSLPELIDKLKK